MVYIYYKVDWQSGPQLHPSFLVLPYYCSVYSLITYFSQAVKAVKS